MVLALAGDSTMTSRDRPPVVSASATSLLLPRLGELARRPRLGGYAGRRLADQLAKARQPPAADDAVRRAVAPRPHEGTRYPCGGQGGAHSRPRLLVGGAEAERVSLAPSGRVPAAGAD